MKVLVQIVDRNCGGIERSVVHLNDGPNSLLIEGKPDLELLAHCFGEHTGEDDLPHHEVLFKWMDFNHLKDGSCVLCSGEEMDYIFTNLDMLLVD